MGLLLKGKQLSETHARQLTISANYNIIWWTSNSATDIAAKGTLLLTVSNLIDLHSDYNSLLHTPALKQLLQSWNY